MEDTLTSVPSPSSLLDCDVEVLNDDNADELTGPVCYYVCTSFVSFYFWVTIAWFASFELFRFNSPSSCRPDLAAHANSFWSYNDIRERDRATTLKRDTSWLFSACVNSCACIVVLFCSVLSCHVVLFGRVIVLCLTAVSLVGGDTTHRASDREHAKCGGKWYVPWLV